ncbi:MAG: histidine kinase [Bacteroidota bacterium]
MSKKGIYIILWAFLALFSQPGWAQKKEAAEKKASAPSQQDRYRSYKARSSGEGVNELLNDAYLLKETNPKEALNKVEEALGISIAQENGLNEARCYVLLGQINEHIEEWKLASENYKSAYEKLAGASFVSPKSSETTTTAATEEFKVTLRGLGNTNLRLGNYDDAMRFYQQSLSLKLTSTERAAAQLEISEVYYQMGNYANALKAVDDIGPSKVLDESLAVAIQNQKAKIYARTNEVEKARSALQSSQNTLNASPSRLGKKDEASLKDAKEEVAGALHEQRRYDDEIDLRNQSIEYNLESNNLPEVTKDKVGLSKALAAKGETSAAIKELEEAAHIADTINNPKDQAKAFLALANLYEKNGRNTEALNTYKKYSDAVKKTDEQNETTLIEKSELITKQKDIEELTKDVALGQREEKIQEATVFRQQLIIYGLLMIILIIAVTSYFIYKNAMDSKVANQMLALKSLRSQMNPHFIFNALNSVNQFVAQNDERTTNRFLSEFSRLMRLVLENSQEDFIPLVKEQEIISLYLKLEHYRFRDKFDYEIKIDERINLESIEIPPMLLQPYIENAVWHGLRYKETKGHLTLSIGKNAQGLQVEIVDDGIGRKRSAELKTENQKKHNSTGLKNIRERLNIINKVYHVHYDVQISDLDTVAGTGTRVLIHLPVHKQKEVA